MDNRIKSNRADGEPPFRILALSGGGLNGALAAGILKSTEETLGKRISDHFDLIVGTSTGGILALGLGLGIPTTSLVDFYRTRGEKVFPKPRSKVFRFLTSLARATYSAEALNHELQQVLGEKLLGESSVPLVIASYDLAANDIRLFKTRHHSDYKFDFKLPAWKIARATSAAPTYLPACREIEQAQLIDGGVYANNPIMIGITEAMTTFGVPAGQIRILSLGTTRSVKRQRKWLDKAGMLRWGLKASDLFIEAHMALALSQARRFVGKENMLHIDPSVAEGEFKLDLYQPDRHESLSAYCARHHIPDIERMFFESPAAIGASALANPIGGLQYAA